MGFNILDSTGIPHPLPGLEWATQKAESRPLASGTEQKAQHPFNSSILSPPTLISHPKPHFWFSWPWMLPASTQVKGMLPEPLSHPSFCLYRGHSQLWGAA